jgi:hypothetical protein
MAQSTSVIPADEQSNFVIFRDCLSEPVLRILAAPPKKQPKSRRRVKKSKKASKSGDTEAEAEKLDSHDDEPNAAEDLADFIDVRSPIRMLPNHLI